jgi:Flp pilus assembly CpaF family ATPase
MNVEIKESCDYSSSDNIVYTPTDNNVAYITFKEPNRYKLNLNGANVNELSEIMTLLFEHLNLTIDETSPIFDRVKNYLEEVK